VIAVDTNIIVRIVVADDRDQLAKARRLLERNDVFVGTTVLLECEWVLRSAYKLDRASIERSLRGIVSLDNVHTHDPEAVAKALELFASGVDFADALHLSLAVGSDAFATFDATLRKKAARLPGMIEVVGPH
jgi:predicted nucleic-acid-binding protein